MNDLDICCCLVLFAVISFDLLTIIVYNFPFLLLFRDEISTFLFVLKDISFFLTCGSYFWDLHFAETDVARLKSLFFGCGSILNKV